MGVPAGPWHIDDLLTFTVVTHKVDTGVLTDADSVPTYRVYEDETGTAILTGSMAKLDDANTTGFYSEQITLSAANGFENGKSYSIYISATVNSIVGGQTFNFKVDVPDVNIVSAAGTAWASGAITAAAFAANAITAAKLDPDVTTELQAGLATQALLTTVAGYIDTEITTLQTSVDDLPTNAELATALAAADDAVLAQIALVKAKTDSLTFTVAGAVDANIEAVNGAAISGTGSEAEPWGP